MTTPRDEPALDLAQRALRHAGGDAQVTVVRERSLLARFARSTPTQATDVDDLTLHVLALHDGHAGTATTNRTDEAGLADVARGARDGARAIALRAGGRGDHPGLPAPPADGYRGHAGFDAATAEPDPALAGAALRTAFGVAAEHGLEAFGIWTAGCVETAIASSTGLRAHDRSTDAYIKVICRNDAGRSGWGADAAVGAAGIDAEATARAAAGKVRPGEPDDVPVGEYDVVLDADAVGTLLGFLGGLAFNGLAHCERRGALDGRLGERVAAAAINLADSPRFPGQWQRSFDADGIAKAPLPLIRDGVAHAVVHDSRSAARAGVASTGHAAIPGGAPDGPSPSHLVLAGGGADGLDALAAPIERGLYITRLWYVNTVEDKRTLVTGTTRDGTFWIEDGVIARPARDVRFTDSILRILAATEDLGARARLVAEADYYERRAPVGVICPPLRARGLRVTG